MIEREIIRAIADAKDTEPEDLDLVLHNWVDLDAVRQLIDHDGTDWSVQFEVPDHTVTVTSEGVILVDGRGKRAFC